MDIFDTLWIERYRPKTLKDLVLSDENRELFEGYRKSQNIPNIVFIGAPGTGKTTLSKIIVNDILNCQYFYLNASDESGIDTIRTKVINFAQTKSIDGKIKIIILDECDGLTGDAQRALRNTMEEYSSITRFILTANYGYRVTEALKSRCIFFDLTPPKQEDIVSRLKHIIVTEKIKFEDKDVIEVVRFNYPDLRKSIGQIQKYSNSGTLVLPKQIEAVEFVGEIFKLLKAKLVLKIRKWVIENETKFSSDYPNLLRMMFNYTYDQKIDDKVKTKFLIIISEYIYRSSSVLDQEINMYACILQLSECY